MELDLNGKRLFDPWHCSLEDFDSADPAMVRCLELARVAAQTDLPILILGESGTGKTLLARAIHNSSARAHGPFISFNAAALSDTLLDSQLFGHEKGAFTGAQRTVKGKFELAHGGTLFLDEIADMSLAAQAKILRAAEYGEFERLGSEKLQAGDVRLISATHWPLHQFIESERFRKDLFYRLSGITLTLPPLRERPHDLRSLIAAEIAAASRKQCKPIVGLDKAAAERLLSYHWPGNLRELSRVIHAAVALSPGNIIPAEAILLEQSALTGVSPWREPVASLLLPSRGGRSLHHPSPSWGKDQGKKKQDLTLKTVEQRHIRMVLEQVGGKKRQAARVLGISRATLDRKLSAMSSAPSPDTEEVLQGWG